MKKNLLVLLSVFYSLIYAQDFPVLTGEYLGQTPPEETPVVFAQGIITGYLHHPIAISPKGNEIFWVVNVGNEQMFYSKLENGTWTKPAMAGFVDSRYHHTVPAFSPDGERLFFTSDRPGGFGGLDVWYVEKTEDGWGQPTNVGEPYNSTGNESTPLFTKKGNAYRLGFTGADPQLCYKYSDGQFTDPTPVGEHPDFNPYWSIFISPEEDYLIFTTDPPDLYICFKNEEDQWGAPINMGDKINTTQWERFPSLSPDGKYLFFNRGDGTANKLYWVSTSIINDIKKSQTGETVSDIDGNIYQTVTIGTQVWMSENLRTTRYRNGDSIGTTNPATLNITDESAPKYMWFYNDDETNVADYGRMYTWYAVIDNRNIAPDGWHVPNDTDWRTLLNFLGGASDAHGKLKEAGTSHWDSPNSDATNESGFNGLPGGSRWPDGSFDALRMCGHFWSTTSASATDGKRILLNYEFPGAQYVLNSGDKKVGWSVRCVKDTPAGVNDSKSRKQLPRGMRLDQNFPNPFNSSTQIYYELVNSSQIKVSIYNLLGQKIRTLVDSYQKPGDYSIVWNGMDEFNYPVSSGIYFYSLSTNENTLQKKMVLIQ